MTESQPLGARNIPSKGKILVKFTPQLLHRVDELADYFGKTRSEFIRDACNEYSFKQEQRRAEMVRAKEMSAGLPSSIVATSIPSMGNITIS